MPHQYYTNIIIKSTNIHFIMRLFQYARLFHYVTNAYWPTSQILCSTPRQVFCTSIDDILYILRASPESFQYQSMYPESQLSSIVVWTQFIRGMMYVLGLCISKNIQTIQRYLTKRCGVLKPL